MGDDGAAAGVGVDVADGVQVGPDDVGLDRDSGPSAGIETLPGRATLAFV